jgi:hypothetical protein
MVRAAPLTPARLRALTGLVALALLAVGAIAGQATRRRALFALGDVAWGRDAVTVSYSAGSTPLALALLVLVLAALAACCWWGGRLVATRTFADPDGARRWTLVAGAVWAVAVVGAAIGWATTTADDAIRATAVADHLRDEGDDVGAAITSGESSVVRPGGSGGTALTAPLVIEFALDGSTCALVVDDPLRGDGDTLALTPSC